MIAALFGVLMGGLFSFVHAEGAALKLRLAILELRNEASLPDAQIAYLTDQIRGQASKNLPPESYMVMTRESIVLLLPPGKTLADCVKAQQCEVEVGRTIGADYIVTGEVLRIDDELRLNLKVHHCGSGAFLGNTRASGLKLKALEADLAANGKELFKKVTDHAVPSADAWSALEGSSLQRDGKIGAVPPTWSPTGQKRGVVRFTSEPDGAMVLADGRVICQATPCSKALPVGTRNVQMQKERYLVRSDAVQVNEADEPQSLSWKLSPTFGWLTIQSQPNGLPVTVNGKDFGTTPIEHREMDPGQYLIKVADTLYYEAGERATVVMGNEKRVELTPVQRSGALDVTAVDDESNDLVADVSVDGVLVGRTPGVFAVAVGPHEIVVSKSGAQWTSQAVVSERTTLLIQGKLKGASFSSRPVESTVDINTVIRGNLMWTIMDNGADVNWFEASGYISSCRAGGFVDWRMPTSEELASLYDKKRSLTTRDEEKAYLAHVVAPFVLTTPWQWCRNGRDGSATCYYFTSGKVVPSDPGSRGKGRVLCVRER